MFLNYSKTFPILDVLSALVPNESTYQINISDVIPAESKWAHEVDALHSFLEGTRGDNMRYWDGKTLLRVIRLMILSCTMRLCWYMKMSRC